jgi:hypothetical protein
MDMRFGIGMFAQGSGGRYLKILDLVGAQEVRRVGDGTGLAGEYTFLFRKANESHELGKQLRGQSLLAIGCDT